VQKIFFNAGDPLKQIFINAVRIVFQFALIFKKMLVYQFQSDMGICEKQRWPASHSEMPD
jgi:hypothetical protein